MNDVQASSLRLPDGKAVADRTIALLAAVREDANAVALDALLSAYVNESYRRDQRVVCAAMLLRVGRMMADDQLPLPSSQEAVNAEASAAPAGYSDQDVAATKDLLDQLAKLLEDRKHHVALSALLTMYVQVADTTGNLLPAARHLLTTGGRIVADEVEAGRFTAAATPAGATLH